MQLTKLITLLQNARHRLHRPRCLPPLLFFVGASVFGIAFHSDAHALDFDPETVQLSDLFPADSYVNPKDFGAVGDGVTDDTNAILAAIAAIEARGQGVIVFDEGDYYCPSWPRAEIGVPIGIQGNNATLRGNGNARLFQMQKQFLIEGMRFENWRKAIEFRNVGDADNYDDTNWVIIRDNHFELVNHPMHAYRAGSFRAALTNEPNPNKINHVMITRNIIHKARSGIRIAAIHVDNITISENVFDNLVQEDFDSDPDATNSILSAISIGQDGESMDNGQKISNLNILNNDIRNLYNFDTERNRLYGILIYRGPDRVAGNWLQNFQATSNRVMGIYTRSASDAITEYNTLVDVNTDYSDTPTPSIAAISSKKSSGLNHLVRGNTIIFTQGYKNSNSDAYGFNGMLFGNQNIEYRDNLVIGAEGGGINTWRLSSTGSAEKNDLVFDNNILINCVGDAFSNYFGRRHLDVTNNTLVRHEGSLFHHGSLSVTRSVHNLNISGNKMLQQRGDQPIIDTSGEGIQTESLLFRNNVYEHIGTLKPDTFTPHDGGRGMLGAIRSDFYNEDSVFKIDGNTIIGMGRDLDSGPTYILRLYSRIKELSVSENFFRYGMRGMRFPGDLPQTLAIRDNHIEDFSSYIINSEPSDEEWNATEPIFSNNTGNFSSETRGDYQLVSVGPNPLRDYPGVPGTDAVAARVAERIFNLRDEKLKEEMRTELHWLIGDIPAPESNAWTFTPLGIWKRN